MNTPTGRAKLAGVIGWPIAHSRSPQIHNFWLESLGIDGIYVPMPVRPDDLRLAVSGLRAVGFRGFNVTIPHKEAIIEFMDRLDPAAACAGAVNTVVFHEDGTIKGLNTDGQGFMANLLAMVPSWRALSGPVTIIGAGGAAQGIAAVLLEAGVRQIRIVNRSPERTARMVQHFGADRIAMHAWEDYETALDGSTLLVNTAPVDWQLAVQNAAGLRGYLEALPEQAVVADIVYNPLETPLLAEARRHGHPAVDGMGMLLQQARPSFAAWFGIAPDIDEALRNHVLAGR